MILNNTLEPEYNLNEKIYLEFLNEDITPTYQDDLNYDIIYSFQGNYFTSNQKLINNKLKLDLKINENNIIVDKLFYYYDYNTLIEQNKYKSNLSVDIYQKYGSVNEIVYSNSNITSIINSTSTPSFETFLNKNDKYIKNSDSYIKLLCYANSSYTLYITQYNINDSIINQASELKLPNYSNIDYKYIKNLDTLNILSNAVKLKIQLFKDVNLIDEYIMVMCNESDYLNIVYLDKYYFFNNLYMLKYDDSININSNISIINDESVIVRKKYNSNYIVNSDFIVNDIEDQYNQLYNSNTVYYIEYVNNTIIKKDRLNVNNTEFRYIKNESDTLDIVALNLNSITYNNF